MFLIAILGVGVVAFLIWLLKEDAKMQKREKEEQAAKEEYEAWKRAREEKELAYTTLMSQEISKLESQFGKCTKNIYVDCGDAFMLKDRVLAFEEGEKIVLDGTVFDFKDIIGLSLLNKSKTIYNAYTTGTSRKNVGGAVVRGIAGKVIAGDMGAVIGAMTAEDDYETETEYDYEEENEYKIYVNVNSIASPTVILDFGSLEEDAYEVANLLNVIINRNNNRE